MKLVAILILFLLGGCATHSEQGRGRALAPQELGVVYSEVEMQTRLVLTPEALCEEDDCIATQEFRTRLLEIGEQVIDASYSLAFERDMSAPSFLISVPPKDDIGTLSSATGEIVIFGGVRNLRLSNAALAFLMAREIGHVLARHHDENAATSIGVSIAVSILFPMTNILRGAEVAYAALATTSLASTAVSFAGTRILRGLYRADQLSEANAYALEIITLAGWTPHEVSAGLHAAVPLLIGEGWISELRDTIAWLDQSVAGPPYMPLAPEPTAAPPLVVLPPLAVEEMAERRLVFVDLTAPNAAGVERNVRLPPCTPALKKAGRPCAAAKTVVPKKPATPKKPLTPKKPAAPQKIPPARQPQSWG